MTFRFLYTPSRPSAQECRDTVKVTAADAGENGAAPVLQDRLIVMPASLSGEMERGTTASKYVSMPLDKVIDMHAFPKWKRAPFLL